MYVVHTSAANMPSSCWGRYRNVYVIQVLYYDWNRGWRPKTVSSKSVLRRINLGHHSVGKTERCAYQQALKRAEALVQQLNSAGEAAETEQIIGAGGSA